MELKNIVVYRQEELDAIPNDYDGCIKIQFGTFKDPAYVKNKDHALIFVEGYTVRAYGRALVTAYGTATVYAHDTSRVQANNQSFVYAYELSQIDARADSNIKAYDRSIILSRDMSTVHAYDHSYVITEESTAVKGYDHSIIDIAGYFTTVYGNGHTTIVDYAAPHSICHPIDDTVTILTSIETVQKYCELYQVECNAGQGIFYKAVHKKHGRYFSDFDPAFEYHMGKITFANCFDPDITHNYTYGIHIAALQEAFCFGMEFDDLAILAVEVPLDSIVVTTDGILRCPSVKVLREVPLDELIQKVKKEREWRI